MKEQLYKSDNNKLIKEKSDWIINSYDNCEWMKVTFSQNQASVDIQKYILFFTKIADHAFIGTFFGYRVLLIGRWFA